MSVCIVWWAMLVACAEVMLENAVKLWESWGLAKTGECRVGFEVSALFSSGLEICGKNHAANLLQYGYF